MEPVDPTDEREWEIHKAFEKKEKEIAIAIARAEQAETRVRELECQKNALQQVNEKADEEVNAIRRRIERVGDERDRLAKENYTLRAKRGRLWEAVDYMGNSLNWIESYNGYEMKRPGGGGRSGILLVSETLTPWAYINKVMGLRIEQKSQE